MSCLAPWSLAKGWASSLLAVLDFSKKKKKKTMEIDTNSHDCTKRMGDD